MDRIIQDWWDWSRVYDEEKGKDVCLWWNRKLSRHERTSLTESEISVLISSKIASVLNERSLIFLKFNFDRGRFDVWWKVDREKKGESFRRKTKSNSWETFWKLNPISFVDSWRRDSDLFAREQTRKEWELICYCNNLIPLKEKWGYESLCLWDLNDVWKEWWSEKPRGRKKGTGGLQKKAFYFHSFE